VNFDPRAPDEIKAAHEFSAKKKRERLNAATALSLIGALAVILAIVTASLVEENKETAGFSAIFDRVVTETQAHIVLAGAFPAGSKVVVTVAPKGGTPLRRVAITPSGGQLEKTLSVPLAESYDVTATWDEEKIGTRSLTKVVAGEKAGS
jgi:hypothetical protein